MKRTIVVLFMFIFLLTGCDFFSTTANTSSIEHQDVFKYTNCNSYKDVYKSLTYGGSAYMPSTGNVKVLIVPIWFENVGMTKSDKYIQDIKKTFFGTETDTGWESVKSYFYESSYGKMNYSGYVTDWYTPINNAQYYENAYKKNNYNQVIGELIVEVLNYYDSTINYKDYDSDDDKVIDAIYLLYNRPVEMYDDAVWWAWQSYYQGQTRFDSIDAYQYMWAGIDFMYYDNEGNKLNNNKLNASTYIHESTHLMGADDYYDYSENVYQSTIFGKKLVEKGEGCNYGIGDYDMMDANIGDHNAVTKMLLGWTCPNVVTHGSYEIELNKFSQSGDCVVVCPNWRDSTNILSEFFVIDYYDGTGLDSNNEFTGEQFNTQGIRIYHVNATVEKTDSVRALFKYDNSYTDHAFMGLIDANSSITKSMDFIDSSEKATSKSLFKVGQTFTPNNCNEYIDKELLNVSVYVKSATETSMTITITVS